MASSCAAYSLFGWSRTLGPRSRGDSYYNAAAEAVNALYKAELIYRAGPWRTVEDVELAALAWVDWHNRRRLHGCCRNIPPAEYEDHCHQQQDPAGTPSRENSAATKTGAIQSLRRHILMTSTSGIAS